MHFSILASLSLFLVAAVPIIVPCRADLENYQIPASCRGVNPVVYLGIDTNGSQQEAEKSLGNKLNNPDDLDIIGIYCVLSIDDNIFAPGQCPREMAAEEMNNDTVSLAYVFSRPTTYAEAYLRIQAPIHYYSLGTLSKKVALRASENQTLRLMVANLSESRECWEASSKHQRNAFIHRLLNKTLSRMLYQVNRSAAYLQGTISIREKGDTTVFGRWPFPFGTEYVFESCQTSLIPLSVSLENAWSLNYTICSHWSDAMHSRSLFTKNLAILFNIFFSYVCCLGFVYLWPWLSGKSYKIARQMLHRAFPRPKAEKVTCFQATNISNATAVIPKFFRNGAYPRELSIGYILRAESLKKATDKWTLKSLPTRIAKIPFRLPPVYYAVTLLLVAMCILVYVNVWFPMHTEQRFDSKQYLWSSCSDPTSSNFLIASLIIMVLLVGLLVGVCGRDYYTGDYSGINIDVESGQVADPTLRQWSIIEAAASFGKFIKITLSVLLLVAMPLVALPLLANLLMVSGFTLVGLLTFYRTRFLSAIAIGKIILFDILRVDCLSQNISPRIYACKRAVDEAARSLEGKIISASTSRLGYAARAYDASAAELHAEFHKLFGVSQSTSGASVQDKINASMTRAFLLLCVYSQASTIPKCFLALRRNLVSEDRQLPGFESLRTYLAVLSSRAFDDGTIGGEKRKQRLYTAIRNEIVAGILERFDRFVNFAIAGVIGWVGFLLMLEVILYHIGELTSTSSWLELLIPGSILLQSLVGSVMARSHRFVDSESELILEAQSILLLLATQLDDTDSLGDGSVIVLSDEEVAEIPNFLPDIVKSEIEDSMSSSSSGQDLTELLSGSGTTEIIMEALKPVNTAHNAQYLLRPNQITPCMVNEEITCTRTRVTNAAKHESSM